MLTIDRCHIVCFRHQVDTQWSAKFINLNVFSWIVFIFSYILVNQLLNFCLLNTVTHKMKRPIGNSSLQSPRTPAYFSPELYCTIPHLNSFILAFRDRFFIIPLSVSIFVTLHMAYIEKTFYLALMWLPWVKHGLNSGLHPQKVFQISELVRI